MSPPKYVDFLLLAAALAVFIIGDFPMLGFIVGAACWIIQRGVEIFAAKRANEELRNGNRQKAMGIVGATTLGRVWLMATAILVVGIGDREAGLSAAVLVLVLFTVSFAAKGIAHLFGEDEQPAAAPRGQGA